MTDDETRGARGWQRRSSSPGRDEILFRIRHDELVNPRNGELRRAVVLETPDWVNVVPITADGRLVMVRQYRFGTERLTLEIPGGLVDSGEEPRATAERELREETGYTTERWSSLGGVAPNPAFHDNVCHHYLAEGVRRTARQDLDLGEDIEVVLVPLGEVREMVLAGEVDHSLVISALSRVLDLRQHRPG